MSTPALDLQGIKNLFVKGIEYSKKNYPKGLFENYDELSDYQLSLANKAQDITTLMNCIGIPNPSFNTTFNGPKEVCRGSEIQYNPIQFGVGNNEWYFTYGVADDICFNITFGKTEIASPQVVKEMGLEPSEAVRWAIGGGYGKVGGDWYSIPEEAIYMKYTQPTYSTFSLNTVEKGKYILSASLSNLDNPLQFKFSVNFIDTNGKERSIIVNMLSLTPPIPNCKDSCCACSNDMGSLYISFTDMDVKLAVDSSSGEKIGKGWIDHQLFKSGIPKSLTAQASSSVLNTLMKPVTGGWLWFAIQDYESDTQYMFTHFFGNKFYKDDIQLNQNISMQLINVYKKGIAHYSPTRTDMDISDLNVKMTQTIKANGMDLPFKYSITLPGGKEVILVMASSPNVYNFAYGHYENPALLYDKTMSKIIGIGVIEANGYLTTEQYAPRYIAVAGGDVNDQNALEIVKQGISPNLKQTSFNRFLAFLIILIPLWLIILATYFIFKSKDKRKERAMIVIAFLLIYYGITYIPKNINCN